MSINQSLAHGLEIIFLYNTATPLFTVSEISKKLGYSQSKTYRLVRTLIKYGLLQENPGTAQYSLGLSALKIGLLVEKNLNLAVVARPFMEKLSVNTRETILLTGVNGTKGVCLERVESEEPIRYSFSPFYRPGVFLSLHCGASGKILMAYLPEEDWDRIIAKEGLKRYTPNTITDVNRLKAHLRQIRRKGYAFSDSEVDREVRAVAAPILDCTGALIAGLAIAGPSYRINKKRVTSLASMAIKVAQEISVKLG